MVIDAHCHMFTRRIVDHVSQKEEMVAQLCLDTEHAYRRLRPHSLEAAASVNGVDACFLLPTANVTDVQKENDRHYAMTIGSSRIKTLATLHPSMERLEDEIRRMLALGVPGFKFSSFTQRFDLESSAARQMLASIQTIGREYGKKLVAVFDTFIGADRHFGADPRHLTTPQKLDRLAEGFPEINIVGAHMGGLMADFRQLASRLRPRSNLFLDTANAAHTFSHSDFATLVQIHSTSHVLFGTDWPWFNYREEIPFVRNLCSAAGFGDDEIRMIMGGNAEILFFRGRS